MFNDSKFIGQSFADRLFKRGELRAETIYGKQGLEYLQGKEIIVKTRGFTDTLTLGTYKYKGNNTFNKIRYLKGNIINSSIQKRV